VQTHHNQTFRRRERMAYRIRGRRQPDYGSFARLFRSAAIDRTSRSNAPPSMNGPIWSSGASETAGGRSGAGRAALSGGSAAGARAWAGGVAGVGSLALRGLVRRPRRSLGRPPGCHRADPRGDAVGGRRPFLAECQFRPFACTTQDLLRGMTTSFFPSPVVLATWGLLGTRHELHCSPPSLRRRRPAHLRGPDDRPDGQQPPSLGHLGARRALPALVGAASRTRRSRGAAASSRRTRLRAQAQRRSPRGRGPFRPRPGPPAAGRRRSGRAAPGSPGRRRG
jgi:hypothetical protein